MNLVILSGNLGADPEIKYTQNGTAIASFSLATTEKWKNDDGVQEHTEWHKIIVWGPQAESCKNYLTKGKRVNVMGKIQTRKYTNNEGKEMRVMEIKATSVEFI